MKHEFATQAIITDDGSLTVRHHDHGESYHSNQGALFEAEELYMKRSGLIEALGQGDSLGVLDVGLGLGYNALSTIAQWWAAPSPGALRLLSLEIDRELFAALRGGDEVWQASWPDAWRTWVGELREQSNERWACVINHPQNGALVTWEVYLGDAAASITLLPESARFNFIWQDAFSPQHNPNLWQASWFVSLAKRSAPHAILMTYSVSRLVRDNLTEAGWLWEKIPGGGTKRHWLRAKKA
jgi:tRNA U34 5-methylaminomethyl-2-thiouridine-forming methyltransferase MnmC